MENEEIGRLLGAYAHSYYSIPLSLVRERLLALHPEITGEQLQSVLKETEESVFAYHCCVIEEKVEEPELVAESVYCFDVDLDRFLAVRRRDLPWKDLPEEILLAQADCAGQVRTPELEALEAFCRRELGLDEEETQDLISGTYTSMTSAMLDGKSWVPMLLRMPRFDGPCFRDVEQLKEFGRLAADYWRTQPSPVLRGWCPCEVPGVQPPPDDFIREEVEEQLKRLAALQSRLRRVREAAEIRRRAPSGPARPALVQRAIGRNDPCPCGSGKKYKNCCGRPEEKDT
jgi:uncharacterized protein YecA (UPF0149 family)